MVEPFSRRSVVLAQLLFLDLYFTVTEAERRRRDRLDRAWQKLPFEARDWAIAALHVQ